MLDKISEILYNNGNNLISQPRELNIDLIISAYPLYLILFMWLFMRKKPQKKLKPCKHKWEKVCIPVTHEPAEFCVRCRRLKNEVEQKPLKIQDM